MKISYTITKKRGLWRPVLSYELTKEDWEFELKVPGGEVPGAKVPVAMAGPPHADRAGIADGRFTDENYVWRVLQLPWQHEKGSQGELRLPWRAGARPPYPEVEVAFQALQTTWEERVRQALASEAMEITGEVEPSPEYKKAVAPYVAARRMLGG